MAWKLWGLILQNGMQWNVVASLHNGVQCCGIDWNVLQCDATEISWVVWKRMVPTLSQWNSVEHVLILGNAAGSCIIEWNFI